jgi:hypothetical protein
MIENTGDLIPLSRRKELVLKKLISHGKQWDQLDFDLVKKTVGKGE